MTNRLASSLGLPPRPTAGQVVARAAQAIPVRLGTAPPRPRPPLEVVEAEMGATPDELAVLLLELLPGAEPEDSGGLPVIRLRDRLTGPAVPVLASSSGEQGPDGWYRATTEGIEREAAGRTLPHDHELLTIERGLVVLTEGARWLIMDGRVVLEDPFCRVEAPFGRREADAFLARRRRLSPGLVNELPEPEAGVASPTISVYRPITLLEPGSWADAEKVLGAREGVTRARVRGDRIILDLETGSSVELELRRTAAGWQTQVVSGSFPATGMRLELEGDLVRYTWAVAPNLDPLDDGVRSRLAFDMASDLVRLSPPGGSGQKV